jgi:hypothetical protein
MSIIEQIKQLAKKTTGKDISGETIQEALNAFEKAVEGKPEVQKTAEPAPEKRERRSSYSRRKEQEEQ